MSIISKEIKIFFNSNFQKEKIEFDLSKLYDEIVVDLLKYFNDIIVKIFLSLSYSLILIKKA